MLSPSSLPRLDGGIVGLAHLSSLMERVRIYLVEPCAIFEAGGKIRVGDERPAIGDGIASPAKSSAVRARPECHGCAAIRPPAS